MCTSRAYRMTVTRHLCLLMMAAQVLCLRTCFARSTRPAAFQLAMRAGMPAPGSISGRSSRFTSVDSRGGVLRRWLGLGLLFGGLGGSSARAASGSADTAAKSKLGLDLTPMSESAVESIVKEFPPIAQSVLTRAGTERAFTGFTVNGYGQDTKEDGVWTSAVSGVPLFDSGAKYESGTGWPSFFAPVDPAHIVERTDVKDMDSKPKFLWRTEVLDRKSGTHLGHVFDDGPRPTGKRYCMNAAALRFVPRTEAEEWVNKLPKAKGDDRAEL